jgi:spore coat polysaccharide biosynthesis protein SpsF (cytidylyltransferase family)
LRTHAILQARMNSRRLPGKVLMNLGNQPIVEKILESLYEVFAQDCIFVATSTLSSDDILAETLLRKKYQVRRGSLENVFSRFQEIQKSTPSDLVCRFTADNPFIDRDFVRAAIKTAQDAFAEQNLVLVHSRNSNVPIGMGVEIFSSQLLLHPEAKLVDYDLEHVTSWMYESPVVKKVEFPNVPYGPEGKISLTVDTVEDFASAENFQDWLAGRSPTIALAHEWHNSQGLT